MSLAEAVLDLQELTRRLRRDCPWDREQTARTIVPHTVEEAYEVADAAAEEDVSALHDELGDLLFQVFFLSLLLEEQGAGSLETVTRAVHEKLVRRHPHVFGEAEARTAARVRERWEQIKTDEEGREGVFHDVGAGLPALLLARKVQRRVASVGFEFPSVPARFTRLREELDELGDVLFLTVNLALRLNVDPELALRAASRKFVSRVEGAVELASAEGEDWRALELDDQDRYYERAKGRVA